MSFVDFGWLLLFGMLGAWSVVQSNRIFGHWFTPLSLFVGMNSLSLFAYHLRLVGMNDVSVQTHAVVLTSFAVFVVGTLIALEGRPLGPITGDRSHIDAARLDQFFLITALLATMGWMIGLAILVGRIGIGGLLNNIWVLQTEFQIQFIGYLNLLGILVLPTYVLKRAVGRARPLDLVLTLAAMFGLVLAGVKSYTVYSVLGAMVCMSVVRPEKFRPRHVLVSLLLLLGFFVIYTIRIDIFTRDLYVGDGWFARFPALHRPYIYFVGSWPAMENIVSGTMRDAHVVGAATLQPFYKVAGSLLGLLEAPDEKMPFSDIGTTLFNVYSFVGEVYWDWQWPGVLLFSGGLGFVSTRLYLRARRLAFWGHSLVYAVVGYALFLSCFMYGYRFKEVFLLGYIWLVGFVALRGGVLLARRKSSEVQS